MKKTATISPCGLYRYSLTRRWGEGPQVLWIMLNPSTADADLDDPTIRRCIGFTESMGFEALEVVNLFALRSTDPSVLKGHPDPIGPLNNEHIIRAAQSSLTIVCAWGRRGDLRHRDETVMDLIRRTNRSMHALRLSKTGMPTHPLYLPGDLLPFPIR